MENLAMPDSVETIDKPRAKDSLIVSQCGVVALVRLSRPTVDMTAHTEKTGGFMLHASLSSRFASISAALLMLAALSTPGMAQEKTLKAVSVKTPDGLTISAQDWGNANGPEIVFIHGFRRAICRGSSRSPAISPRNSTW
jgi:hypothetical protein